MQILKLLSFLTLIAACKQTDFSNSRFYINDVGFQGQMKPDTNYYSDHKIARIGHRPIDKQGNIGGLKVGLWINYYHNGQIESKGNYEMCSLLYDSFKPVRLENSFKIGPWEYYYENGQVKAKGVYSIIEVEARTGVDNQMQKRAVTTESWEFYNPDGTVATDKEKIISNIEFVYHE